MSNGKYLIVVGGPTASGKTGLAIQLARHFDTAILSSDSRQFYREMNIGTAKPTAQELAQAPHYFIDSLSVTDTYDVGQFEQEALQQLEDLFSRHSVVILAGGSGLYINALCQGLDAFPDIPDTVRQEVEDLYQQHGLPGLQQAVQVADPDYFAEADTNNPHRLMRALSVCKASGQPFSFFRKGKKDKRNFTPLYIQLQWPRERLYERINQRVDLMFEQGLIEEVKTLLPYRSLTALQTVGYQELFPYLDGQCTLEEAAELIKRNSRRYAKRQLTWMRRDGYWKHFHPSEEKNIIQYLETSLQEGWKWEEQKHEEALILNLKKDGKTLASAHRKERKGQLTIHKLAYTTPTVLYYFLHELHKRTEGKPSNLLIPPEIEPIAREVGFQSESITLQSRE